MMFRRSAVAGTLAALALAGCASSKPRAEVTGRIGASPGLDISAVDIIGIDGQMLFDRKTWRVLSPGPHQLQVLTTRKVRRGDQEPGYMFLLAEPCVRYYIVARHFGDVGSTATDWAPEVARTEPIEGCEAEEKKTPAPVMGGESPQGSGL
jgi:hypothetical protein